MIRGNLKALALKALEKQPLSGYSLMKHIEEKLGTKPSPGSIYPLLDELTKEKIVTCKEEGRQKIYSITSIGKEKLKEINKQKDLLVKNVGDYILMWGEMTGQDMSPFIETVQSLKTGKLALEDIPREVTALKMEMSRILNKGLYTANRKKVNEILKNAAEELKKIK